MKNISILFLICLTWLIMPGLNAIAQPTLEVHRIDPKEYPKVKVTYTYKKADGVEDRTNITSNEILVNENTIARDVIDPFCAPPQDKSFSAILVVDVSGSMTEGVVTDGPAEPRRIDIVKEAVQRWIDSFDPVLSEVAIISFNISPFIISPFSQNKDELTKALNDNLPEPNNGTNYNAAFLWEKRTNDSTKSALHFCKPEIAQFKPVIVFLTDGGHEAKGDIDPFKSSDVVRIARERNAYVFVIKLGDEEISDKNVNNLNSLASVEGSDNLEYNITDKFELLNTYSEIYEKAAKIGAPPRCYFEFVTDCLGGGDVEITFATPEGNAVVDTVYEIPDDLKPELDISIDEVTWIDDDINTNNEKKVSITVENNSVEITGFDSPDGRFDVKEWQDADGNEIKTPFTIEEDGEFFAIIEYDSGDGPFDSNDSTNASISYTITGTACDGNVADARWAMEPFLEDIDMGSSLLNTPLDITFTQVFCNKTFDPINITSIEFDGLHKDDFEVVDPSDYTGSLAPGECLEIEFRFTPSVVGDRLADMTLITADGDEYEAEIRGTGTGTAGISHDPFNVPNTNCQDPDADITITLNNTGPIPLGITSTNIVANNPETDDSEFSITTQPDPSIPGTGNTVVVVRFTPNDQRQKQALLTIVNESEVSNYEIIINARQDSVNFDLSESTINLAVVCLGQTASASVDLTSTGSVDFDVNETHTQTNISLDAPSWTLVNSIPQSVAIDYVGDTQGPINEDIVFTDECGNTKTLTLTGTVADMSNINIQGPAMMESTVGVPVQETYIYTNNSGTDMSIPADGLSPQDAQFTVVSTNPALPCVLADGDPLEVVVSYTPNVQVATNSEIIVTGTPCAFNNSIPLTGNPSLATATIQIDRDYTDVTGAEIDVNINITGPPSEFVESGTTQITTEISFKESLLEIMSGGTIIGTNAGITTVEVQFDIVPQNNNMLNVAQLRFKVLDGGSVDTESELEIANTVSDMNNVVFTEEDGLFTLNPASATLLVESYQASPGESFTVSIYIEGAVNITQEGQSGINTTLRYKASLFEPISNTPKGIIDTDTEERVISLENIEIPSGLSTEKTKIKDLKFRAMLGTLNETDIILESSSVVKGMVNFDHQAGRFNLMGICNSGGERLFNPNGSSGLLIPVPNPAKDKTVLEYETIEKAYTKLWISDCYGNEARNLFEGVPEGGKHTKDIDVTDLANGMYFIILETPTRVYVEKFVVVK